MSEPLRLAIDAMSGDFGPRITIPAALEFARAYPDVQLTLVGTGPAMERALDSARPTLPDNCHHLDAGSALPMDADPRRALRARAQCSLGLCLERVAEGLADGAVSAGNSGALMLLARKQLGMIAPLEAPAFCKTMPVEQGQTLMLDLGGSVDASPDRLEKLAQMGAVLSRAMGVSHPRVALLNIGSESIKGTGAIREAAQRLDASDLRYEGFVEADEIYRGDVDVIVCDGFSGNIALKSSEGVARLIAKRLEAGFRHGWGRVVALLAAPLVRRWRSEFNPDAYNGAVLAGVNGVVVKSHGGASRGAFFSAISVARDQAASNIPRRLRQTLAHSLEAPEHTVGRE